MAKSNKPYDTTPGPESSETKIGDSRPRPRLQFLKSQIRDRDFNIQSLKFDTETETAISIETDKSCRDRDFLVTFWGIFGPKMAQNMVYPTSLPYTD